MKIFCLTFRDVEEAVVILKRQSFPRIVWRFNIRDVALSCDFFVAIYHPPTKNYDKK